MAFDLNVRATDSLSAGVKISWDHAEKIDMQNYTIERQDGSQPPEFLITIQSPSATSWTDLNTGGLPLPGYTYTYIVTPWTGSTTYRSDSDPGKRKANGIISGHVRAPLGGGVEGVQVCAVRVDSVPQGDITTYCDSTDASGYYHIDEIYYYDEATFEITPSKGDHGFNPPMEIRDLKLEKNSETNLDFIDTSSFTVTGRVIQVFDYDTCFMKDVEIHVNDLYWGVNTDKNGNFSLTVDQTDQYTLKPLFYEHGFKPADTTYFINDNLSGVLFKDTTVSTLNGYLRAPCYIYIGVADLRIYSKCDTLGCFDTTITTQVNTGYYTIDLPAREYYMELVKFYPYDISIVLAEDVENYFNTQIIDLLKGDIRHDMIYRKPPVIEITGFDDVGCGQYNVPILEQGKSYFITIEVKEQFGQSSCLTNTGYLVVYNDLVDGPMKVDTLELDNGRATYEVKPGSPNIIAPYLKLFEIFAYVGDETRHYSQDILVVGNHPREQTFVTVTPEIPFMILRDPPGDASYSYLEKGSTSQLALRIMSKVSGSVNAWAQAKLGIAFSAGEGISFSFATWGAVKGSLEVGGSLTTQSEIAMSITNVEQFSTSGNPDITGEEGDVFAGASLNLIYAITDVIEYDRDACTVQKYADLIMGVDGFETTFIYTENHIRNVLIPQLAQIRDIYKASGSDSARYYQNQINAWQQILNLNTRLKNQAVTIENKSFSAGSKYESYKQITRSISGSIEVAAYIEASVAVELGIEGAGSGISGGVETKFRIEMGASAYGALIETTKTGYVFDDDDVGDYFSVDILEDNTYGTPVFKLVSGRSSCPWEMGTQPREGVQLTSNTYYKYVDDPEGQAVFQLTLGNTSNSDEEREYNLVFMQQSNPDGAILTLGGSEVQGGIPTPYKIVPAGSVDAQVTVKRGALAYDYRDLTFGLLSGCDDQNIEDYVKLTVQFHSPCSNISFIKPINNWILNSSNDNTLNITLRDYDTTSLDRVKVQYSPANANSWTSKLIIDKSQLGEDFTTLDLSFESDRDGFYDLRTVVECESGIGYSDIKTGIVDRKPPAVFGIPEPADGILDNGDMISVVFDEEINCMNFSTGNVTLTNLDSGADVKVQPGCSGNKIIILPQTEALVFENDTFELMLTGVEDLSGNAITDTVIWVFTVPGPNSFEISEDQDSDFDGIANKNDNCPIAYNPNQEDMDEDEIGDLCDDDLDGDGIMNLMDNCAYVENADQSDANDNGIGDACDPTVGIDKPDTPEYFKNLGNYPNPFSEYTIIKFAVSADSKVMIRIYNSIGVVVKILLDEKLVPDIYEVKWDSYQYSEGLYFYSIYVECLDGSHKVIDTRKMILSR